MSAARSGWNVLRSRKGFSEFNPFMGLAASAKSAAVQGTVIAPYGIQVSLRETIYGAFQSRGQGEELPQVNGMLVPYEGKQIQEHVFKSTLPFQLIKRHGAGCVDQCFARSFASKASNRERKSSSETMKEVQTVEDPFDSPTYNIPEKPVTFAEGASYSVIILAGLGVAAAAGYAVFKELIFEPKEYKVFNMALKRIQDDSQVRVRIGSPITGYGQESRNRAARQRIPNKIFTDEDGIEHVQVGFFIRGPHGAGKVNAEMFKDKVDKQWKYIYLIVQIMQPSPSQLILESYMPAPAGPVPA